MADLWSAVGMAVDTELDDLDSSDTHWGYNDPVEATCPDNLNLLSLNKLFKLTKESEKSIKIQHHEIFVPLRSGSATLYIVKRNIHPNFT